MQSLSDWTLCDSIWIDWVYFGYDEDKALGLEENRIQVPSFACAKGIIPCVLVIDVIDLCILFGMLSDTDH